MRARSLRFVALALALSGPAGADEAAPAPDPGRQVRLLDYGLSGYPIDVRTKSFSVRDIDFDTGRVLFVHTFTLRGDPGAVPPLNGGATCAGSAVAEHWAVFDANAGTLTHVFPIVPATRKGDPCPEDGWRTRAEGEARATLETLGLDVDQTRTPLRPASRPVRFDVPHPVRDGVVGLRVVTRRARAKDFADDPALALVAATDERPEVALCHLELDGRVLYSRFQTLERPARRGREVSFDGAFISEDEGRAILLERIDHRARAGDGADGFVAHTWFTFSPVLDLESALADVEALPADVAPPPPVERAPVEQPLEADGGQSCGCLNPLLGCGLCGCAAPAALTGCGCLVCADSCGQLFGLTGPGGLLDDDGDGVPDERTPDEVPPEEPKDDAPEDPGQYVRF